MGMVTYVNGNVNIERVPFSELTGATYVSASKTDDAVPEWKKKLRAQPTGEERIAEAVRLMVEQRGKLHIANTANGEKLFMMLFR